MSRMFMRVTLVICAAFLGLGALSGCSNKAATVAEEPVTAEPTPPPAPAPTPEPTVDPNAWKASVKDVFFDFDMYQLRSDARAILQENARLIKENGSGKIMLEGHCDERGTEDYNLALGQRRADAVMAYLKDLGVEVSRMETVSFGEEKPFATGSDESAWAQNRRVHFRMP